MVELHPVNDRLSKGSYNNLKLKLACTPTEDASDVEEDLFYKKLKERNGILIN